MTWVAVLMFGVLSAAGLYLALSRDIFRCVVGLSLLGSAVNLAVFAAGRLGSTTPPLIPSTASQLVDAANPLPQALVLTAIVISLALTCFALVLAVTLAQKLDLDDSDALRYAEPNPGDPVKPALEESTP